MQGWKNYMKIRFTLLILTMCLLFPFANLSQVDCEKFKKDKLKQNFLVKLNHIISKTNGSKTIANYGIEAMYSIQPFRKTPFEINGGIGYFHRQISSEKGDGGFDASCTWMIENISYCLNHIEIPVYFRYLQAINSNKNNSINITIGGSLMYLTTGELKFYKPVSFVNGILEYIPIPYQYNYTFGKTSINAPKDLNPSLNYFFPQLNYKINLGTSYSYKHFSIGVEYNYLLKQFGAPIRVWPGINNLHPTGNTPNTTNINTFVQYRFR